MSGRTVEESFAGALDARWRQHAAGAGRLALRDDGLRLTLDTAAAGRLSIAQLDEGARPVASWRPPLALFVRARWSHSAADLTGTSGFGFWNDPWGPGGFAVPPAWVWVAHYSPPSHVALTPAGPGQGARGAVLTAPPVGRLGLALGNLALRLPGVGRLAVAAAGRMVQAGDVPLAHDLRAWHEYALLWEEDGVDFWLDGTPVGHVPAAPAGPLGFVAWIDNQWAALRASGTAAGGYLATSAAQWLELAHITIIAR